jgi:molybdate transport system substrate-binding protein
MKRAGRARVLTASLLAVLATAVGVSAGLAEESLVIGASPSMKRPVEALSQAFEQTHPGVRIKIYYDSGLDLRRTIAAVGNDRRFFLGTGPLDLVAPGGDELITRLETKYYVLPGTARAYASVPLVLVVPVTLVEAPASFQELGKGAAYRIAVADPVLTELGRQTDELFRTLGLAGEVKGRLDVASDGRGVLDHLLLGQADVGVIFGPEAVVEQERIRVVATAGGAGFKPRVHSMAMNRYCRQRSICEAFLAFLSTPDARAVVMALGYGAPAQGEDE